MYDNHQKSLMDKILKLKEEKSVYIIAHYYQRPEVQDIADFVGDSYGMAIAATKCELDIVLVAGVDFMAETAAILCPDKTVLSPEPAATCPMADRVNIEDIIKYKEENPDSMVVSYVNTSAEIKALTDVCCTSSNAVNIINKIPADKKVIFLPDMNLTSYVSEHLSRELDTYPSWCPTHNKLKASEIEKLKEEYPDAVVLVHPECTGEVRQLADYIGSTAGIIKYAEDSQEKTFIIATEEGILHTLAKKCPDKKFILASPELICPNMKSITLEKILDSIENNRTKIEIEESLRIKAHKSLDEMIKWSSN
ncbi:MAG: quinolinate synthase NadA [Syntrophomonadaceae bacterium]|nr:quinolinate synthase NadA [Syntrophomonadaceae bacterium]